MAFEAAGQRDRADCTSDRRGLQTPLRCAAPSPASVVALPTGGRAFLKTRLAQILVGVLMGLLTDVSTAARQGLLQKVAQTTHPRILENRAKLRGLRDDKMARRPRTG